MTNPPFHQPIVACAPIGWWVSELTHRKRACYPRIAIDAGGLPAGAHMMRSVPHVGIFNRDPLCHREAARTLPARSCAALRGTGAGMLRGGFVVKGLAGGTLSFLFTDVEDSTPLWERHGALMRTVTAWYHTFPDAIILQHGGRRVRERKEGNSLVLRTAWPDRSPARQYSTTCASKNSWPSLRAIATR